VDALAALEIINVETTEYVVRLGDAEEVFRGTLRKSRRAADRGVSSLGAAAGARERSVCSTAKSCAVTAVSPVACGIAASRWSLGSAPSIGSQSFALSSRALSRCA
jgi:hypothetical protein